MSDTLHSEMIQYELQFICIFIPKSYFIAAFTKSQFGEKLESFWQDLFPQYSTKIWISYLDERRSKTFPAPLHTDTWWGIDFL